MLRFVASAGYFDFPGPKLLGGSWVVLRGVISYYYLGYPTKDPYFDN